MSDATKPDTQWPATHVPESTLSVPATVWETVVPSGALAPNVRLPGDPLEPIENTSQTGRYQILEELARGGMGAVLRGRDSELNRDLAVKVLLERYRDDPDILRRFFEEAQIGGQLQHPGIVPIYDLGVFPDKRPFFAMKLVRGRTLAEMLSERMSPGADLPRFLAIFEQVAQTVAYAHSKRVIHRDLKPLNIMVGAFGEVQVMDWGLAKVLGVQEPASQDDTTTRDEMPQIQSKRGDSEIGATTAGSRMGTPAYMPPEQARGEIDRLDERADVFGLGAILCEILTGKPAYTGETMAQVMRKAESADLADAMHRLDHSGVDEPLIAMAKSCLAPELTDRPRDGSAVSLAISTYMTGVQERLRTAELAKVEANARAEAERMQAAAERSRRKMTVALAALLLIVGTIGGGSFLAYRIHQTTQKAEAERAVNEALATATALQAEAERSGSNSEAWKRALDAAAKVRYTLELRPTSPQLARRVSETYLAIQNGEHIATENRKLIDRLDEARLQGAAASSTKAGHFDPDSTIAAYQSAFRDAGLPIGERPTQMIVGRLKKSPDVLCIASVLDQWSRYSKSKSIRSDLNTIADEIDPANHALRAALQKGDRDEILRLIQGNSSGSLSPLCAVNVASALEESGRLEEARRFLDAARARKPGDFWLNFYLGIVEQRVEKPRYEESVRFLTAAVALKPDSPGAWVSLGSAFHQQGKYAEAEKAIREAIRLKPDYVEAHVILGGALLFQTKFRDAEECFRKAIQLKPDYLDAHLMLERSMLLQSEFRGAEQAVRDAIQHIPANPELWRDLGEALDSQAKTAEAERSYREAIRLRPGFARAYSNLGDLLNKQNRYAEAEKVFRELIRLKPDNAEARCILGQLLRSQSRFSEALQEFRQGHELGMKTPNWRMPSAVWVRDCESLVKLESQLPGLIRGEIKPNDNVDRLTIAQFCYDTKRFSAAARLWGDAIAADPKLGDDRNTGYRYNAACSASMAGCGEGKDDPSPDDATRARLRRQALNWLREELHVWQRLARTAEPGGKPLVAKILVQWRTDSDLSLVRDEKGLAKLSEPERKDWQALWSDVDSLAKDVGKP